MPPFAATATVQLIGTQGNRPTFTQLFYFAETAYPGMASSSVAESAYANIWPGLQERVHSAFRLNSIKGRYSQRDPLIVKENYELVVDEIGDITEGDVMPADKPVLMKMIPANLDRFPETNHEFSLGWRQFSGVPETDQNNGLLTSAALSSWNAYFEDIESVEFDTGSGTVAFQLGMVRFLEAAIPPDTTLTYVTVEETYAAQRLGRNERRQRR